MNKRILSIMLAFFICILQLHLPATAANQANVIATYSDGVVTVIGTGFTASTQYTVRVVDQADTNIKAMSQTVADRSGDISASVTAGVLETLSNYTVYINKPDGTLAGSSSINGSLATFTATIKAGSGGRITTGTSGSYAPETIIHLAASADSGYTFNGWTVTGGGTFANAKSASTTFTMPAANVTISANFTYAADDETSTDDDVTSSSPVPTLTPTPAPAVEVSTSKDGDVTVVLAVVTAEKDTAAGTATAKIGVDTVTSLVNQAKEAEASGQKTVLQIKVKSTEDITSVNVQIPRIFFKQVTDNTDSSVKVDAGVGTITFDTKAVAFINSSASEEDIIVSIKKAENSALTEEARIKIGDRQVYDFSVKSGDTQISSFNGGKVEVTIPYTPKAGEKENSIVVYYIDPTGKLVPVRGKFDSALKMFKFTTSHLSRYAIGYNEVNFSDVAVLAWYDEAIGYMSARGIINGVGGGRFAPENKVTRADFLIMVMNAYGIELDTSATDNFTDSGNTYYTNYLGTAKRLGLVSGMGNNRYAPEASISREDMFVILYNALDQLGEMPVDTNGKSLQSFRDADDIAGYAKDVMKLFVANDIVTGDGNHLTPKALATRAEAAQILYNLLSK